MELKESKGRKNDYWTTRKKRKKKEKGRTNMGLDSVKRSIMAEDGRWGVCRISCRLTKIN